MLDNDSILKSCLILAWQPIFYLESCSFVPKVKEFRNYYLDDYDVPEKPTTNPFEKIVANVTEWEVSEEELEFNSDYSYDYDTDSSNDE